jgi:riboflavin kinase/FMN adenylyltransferase
VITVGTFDGVHLGHWELLRQVRHAAAERTLPSMLVTFDPHPLSVVRPESAPPLLTTADEKIEILAESGIDHAVFLHFDRALAGYEPRRFVEEILIRRFGLAHLVIGHDHGFGRNRSGDVDTLRALGGEHGFTVEVVGPVADGAEPISSSRIRRALEGGDVETAASCLGRPYTVRGHVVHGDGRGLELGFPTANIEIPDRLKLLPRDVIYAVRASVPGRRLDGVLHMGPRPTFPGASASVEVHLFDFDGDIYGEPIRISFCARIRGVGASTRWARW